MSTYTLDTSLMRETWAALSPIVRGYVATAMWTLTDEDGDSLDYLGLHDIAPATLRQAEDDCSHFLTVADRHGLTLDTDTERIGHDFWLTRNRHGAGFWDGDYTKRDGDILTEVAHAMGSAEWYVGDDGLVYQY